MATDMHTTVEELLGVVFYNWSMKSYIKRVSEAEKYGHGS
jgi:hypothetical protein